jgi:hypothetical protein
VGPFTLNKDHLREQARANGMCTRCIVRPARQGKAYCQRCTEYVKRYAKKRNQRGSLSTNTGFVSYFDKAMKIADYDSARGHGGPTPLPREHYRSLPSPQPDREDLVEPVHDPVPRRQEQPFTDLARSAASGAAVILHNPIPIPVGLNPWYDEVEGG